jgi:hypothetical protein
VTAQEGAYSQEVLNTTQQQGVVSGGLLGAALKLLGVDLDMTTAKGLAAAFALNLLWGVATMGIAALIGTAISTATASSQMAQFQEQTERMRRELGLLHSGSGLVEITDDFNKISLSMVQANREALQTSQGFRSLAGNLELPTVHEIEIKGNTDMEKVYQELKKIRVGFGIQSPGASIEIENLPKPEKQTTVFLGPIVIQGSADKTEDRQRLVREVRKEMLRTLEAGGVK